MYNNQVQWNRETGPVGTYTWTQAPQKPDPALSNTYTQSSNCPDGLGHLFDTNVQKQSPSHGQLLPEQIGDYPYLDSLPSIQPNVSTVATGPTQPCNLNIVLKADQTDARAESSKLHARVDRLERILDGLEAFLVTLTKKMETRSSSFEEDVTNSLSAITKGMEKFFNRFASHLEDEELRLAQTRIIEVEEAIM